MAAWAWVVSVLALTTTTPGGTRAEMIDLTYEFDNVTHYWEAANFFNLTVEYKGLIDDYWYESNRFSASEHGGTHMDAPIHFYKGGWSLEQIPIDRMVAHAAVVDISERAVQDPDALVTVEDLRRWKAAHGPFTYPTILLVRTDYSAVWTDRSAYFGIAPEQPDTRHFPGLSAEAAVALSESPAVVGVGIDTASIDAGVDAAFPAHRILGASNIFILENLADMSRLPAAGARVMAFPMKISGGSGGPCRVLVECPETA